jgi:hypothetical protein
VVVTAVSPGILGLRGSGIQEQGLMTFKVSDSFGTPVPNTAIDFSQGQPNLVTLNNLSGRTDSQGVVSVGYNAGPEVGVSTISATVSGTSVSGSQQIAVRGARPSASGFFFRCEHASLPVYDAGGVLSMKCEVRLSDRFGNRVGIPTPVNFATEAGAISASVMTKGFDLKDPTSPDEGTVTVTYTTDMGNGFSPTDVTPIDGEPNHVVSGRTLNPRDNLVTLIAMTQGEEAFVDTNHNGLYDANELFVDEGDPFIDANDNNTWDSATSSPSGLGEVRFCGTNSGGGCATYTGPNNRWDSQTTIWVPTWVAFTGAMFPSTTPAGAAANPRVLQIPSGTSTCADYIDSAITAAHDPQVSALIYVYDAWFNSPPFGTTYEVITGLDLQAEKDGKTNLLGSSTDGESLGSIGLDYRAYAVNATPGLPCSTANGTSCQLGVTFTGFNSGLHSTLVFQNSVKRPAIDPVPAAPPLNYSYGCPPADAGNPYNPRPFTTGVLVSNPNAGSAHPGYFTGSYATGAP